MPTLRAATKDGKLVHVGFEVVDDINTLHPGATITELSLYDFPLGYNPAEWKLAGGKLVEDTAAKNIRAADKKNRDDRVTDLKAKAGKTLEERVELLEKLAGL